MNIAGWPDTNLRRFGEYDALASDGKVWTAGALHDRACRFATALIALGVRPGERVILLLANGGR